MPHLRAGSILKVDLSSGKTATEPTARYVDKYLGGRGINTRLVYDLTGPDTDPMGPDNALVFGTGPLTGTFGPGSGRLDVQSKSPMTGLLGESGIGGHWAAELKNAGYDHLVIRGRADRPVYLLIDDDRVEIRDAARLWGCDTYDTVKLIREELRDPDVEVLSIGPAGEKLVKYASIMTRAGSSAGRTGMGAVMGSKNLKAIAARGTRGVKVANPERFFEVCAEAHDAIRRSPNYPKMWNWGTAFTMDRGWRYGLRMVGHHESTVWEHGEEVSPFEFFQENPSRRTGCFACPIQCMTQYNMPGTGGGVVSCMSYTELIWKMKQPDMGLWWETSVQCERYGIDLISVSSILGWVMELWEKGIIDERDTGGVKMEWGSREATRGMIEQIASRQGFGDLLAEDPLTIADTIGRGAGDLLVHVKGLPLYGLNYMSFRSKGLGAAVGVRGDQIRGSVHADVGAESAMATALTPEERVRLEKHYAEQALRLTGSARGLEGLAYEGKARLVADIEEVCAIDDLFMHCKWHSPFLGFPVDEEFLARIYEAGSGQRLTVGDLRTCARRLRTLERAYDVREGITRDRDVLPPRMYREAVRGFFPGDVADPAKFEEMKDEYYSIRGWDRLTGIPTRETLEALGLEDVAANLEHLGRLPLPVPIESMAER